MKRETEDLLLLLDTCGERASMAVARDGVLLGEAQLAERAASSALLQGVRELLHGAGFSVQALAAVGVVSGPGSFTGVRIGLAVAKGLCEASGLPLAAVSRLAVMAGAGEGGLAVLRAGRDEVYVRDQRPGEPARELLMTHADLLGILPGRALVYAEDSLTPLLGSLPTTHMVALEARHALTLVQACLAEGGVDPASLDANYVRHEQAIYRRQQAGA